MSTAELRSELQNYINKADERFLKMVFAMAKEYRKPDIVGYQPDGTPITKEALTKRVKKASERVKSGDFITQDEIEKEIENW